MCSINLKMQIFCLDCFKKKCSNFFMKIEWIDTTIWSNTSSIGVFSSKSQILWLIVYCSFTHWLQVTLLATTRFTLDWIRSKHHILLLPGICFENYSSTYTYTKELYNIASDDYSVSCTPWKVPSVNLSHQRPVVRRRPSGAPLTASRSRV